MTAPGTDQVVITSRCSTKGNGFIDFEMFLAFWTDLFYKLIETNLFLWLININLFVYEFELLLNLKIIAYVCLDFIFVFLNNFKIENWNYENFNK